jgi:hypothetical protein
MAVPVGAEAGMVEHADEHRRHAEHGSRSLGGDEVEHQAGIEVRRQDHRPAGDHRAEHGHHASGGVEQRHGAELDAARPEAQAGGVQPRVVDDAPVMEHGALGETGRAGGVLDLRRRVRAHLRQRPARRGLGAERLPVLKRDHLAQRGQVPADLLQHLGHRARPVGGDQEDAVGLRLAQHVRQLLPPQGGIDRHDRDPGQADGQLEDHPLGDVVGPHRDALARGETAQQRARRALRGLQQLGVAPAPPGHRVHRPLHQGSGVRRCHRRVAQGLADGEA